jgi:lantibiotic modifying enzyme
LAASGDRADGPPHTGFSHGAAGIGLALFELYGKTGRDDFLAAGRKAFAYEDSRFDPVEENWADLRQPAASDVSPPSGHYACTWCHGAPGIALSRLRAAQLDPGQSDLYLTYAQAALRTTLKTLRQALSSSSFDPTLCHGAGGLIEVLWTGAEWLDRPGFRDAAFEAATELARASQAGAGWRSGLACGGPNPSLMVGDSGVGLLFLRIHNPQFVPPLLVCVPPA